MTQREPDDDFLDSNSVMTDKLSKSSFGAETIDLTAGSRTLLVGVNIKEDRYKTLFDAWTLSDSLDELQRLCETAKLEVVGREYQNMQHPSSSTFVGRGKLEEIKTVVDSKSIATVVFDDELSPAQGRNIQDRLGQQVQVIDRTMLILFIFAQRARTREATLQVAAAQRRYMLPRLSFFLTEGAGLDATGGSTGGGAFLKGKGETQLEMDRRLFRKEISRIEKEIQKVQRVRALYREKRRKDDQIPIVAIVGYTNSGKSTLLNSLLSTKMIYADDLLFATLDTTTRRVVLPSGRKILMSDTVGFIQKLPTKLVAAFSATMDELLDAAVVLHVVDASSKFAENQVRSVQHIISDLGANNTPQILALNKADKVLERDQDGPEINWGALDDSITPNAIVEISGLKGVGLEGMLETIETILSQLNTKVECVVPYSKGGLLNDVHAAGTVLSTEYTNDGTRIVAYVPSSLSGRLEKETIDFSSA